MLGSATSILNVRTWAEERGELVIRSEDSAVGVLLMNFLQKLKENVQKANILHPTESRCLMRRAQPLGTINYNRP